MGFIPHRAAGNVVVVIGNELVVKTVEGQLQDSQSFASTARSVWPTQEDGPLQEACGEGEGWGGVGGF